MKGNDVSAEDIKKWNEKGYFPVSCRLCGKVEIFPKKFYKPNDLQEYECVKCKSMMKFMEH